MTAPRELLALVDRFDQNRAAYRSGAYNEAQARIEFIDPMFRLLGWDMNNDAGYAEQYKDVVHEDSLQVDGEKKAPDYCFRIGGTRKFFLEAKKPSVNLKDDISPAFQLRRYAWSSKLPLSILTDFEEFAVYDCRSTPVKSDKSSTGRTLYLTYHDYAQRWDEVAALFAREAVLKGAFDRYAASSGAKRGTAEVDDVFLKDIEAWRDLLAHNIALRNPNLTQRDLNHAVQATIDRIIFLRICEDRGIEEYGRLQALQNGGQVYARLCNLFQSADERYNSGLFHFRAEKGRAETADHLTLTLTIDDKPLKDILKSLYYPESPYEFSVLPADILGQVYEQFLGKVIRLTPGHRAEVEDKPEVKKAGGVYYTPTYIVDYIVEQTVGARLQGSGFRFQPLPASTGKGRTRSGAHNSEPSTLNAEPAPLRILDPACGSGSFLISAYQRLLDWHRDWYAAHDPQTWATGHAPTLYQASGGEWKLTTAERKRILLDNIFGVDIDPQAVEVTKLSLLLKVLEGENEQTLATQLRLFQERALPDLSNNIKCGNSLIGPDFYDNRQMGLLDDEERYRINVFDWQAEFPQVFAGQGSGVRAQGSGGGTPSPKSGGAALPSPMVGRGAGGEGGFDVVIGNPPYGAELSAIERSYLADSFKGQTKTGDTYELFLLKAADLLRRCGLMSMIIPASWLTGENYALSRKHLVDTLRPTVAYALPFDVFKGAYIDTAIVVMLDDPEVQTCLIHFFPKKVKLSAIPDAIGVAVSRDNIQSDPLYRLSPIFSDETAPIVSKLVAVEQRLGECFEIRRGVQPYSRAKHTERQIRERFLHSDHQITDEYMPELQGSELSRYHIQTQRTSYIRYCDMIASNRPLHMFSGPRITLRRLLTRKFRIQASLATETFITTDNVLNLVPISSSCDVAYALGILNSRLLSWLYVSTSMIAQKDDFPQVHISALSSLPLPEADKARHNHMVEMVERMLALHKQLAAANTSFDKTAIQRQIDATDKQIDRLVYELYGLTDEEIAVVANE